ncbi:hypothetical protein MRB53_040429 [Persea americana]|nr:hypothetical protein MRB53_040429 [Persea americana]
MVRTLRSTWRSTRSNQFALILRRYGPREDTESDLLWSRLGRRCSLAYGELLSKACRGCDVYLYTVLSASARSISTVGGPSKSAANFAYQLYLASDKPMKDYTSEKDFRKFFNALFQPGKGMRMDFNTLRNSKNMRLPISSPSPRSISTSSNIPTWVSGEVRIGTAPAS